MIQFSATPFSRALPVQTQPMRQALPQFSGDLYKANLGIPEDRFYPPKPNRGLLWVGKQLVHWAGSKPLDFKLIMSKEDKKRFREIAQNGETGVIVNPNHSHLLDVLTIIELSRQTKVNFAAMGAIELFERRAFGRTWTWPGALLQSGGVFSVNRGAKDKTVSLKTGEQVVAAKKNPLLLFPDGHVTWTNQKVEHFKHGAFHIALQVVNNGTNVQIVPLAFFYDNKPDLGKRTQNHVADMEKVMADRLTERGIKVDSVPIHATLNQRTERLFGLMLAEKELNAGIQPDLSADAYERLDVLKNKILSALEAEYMGGPKPGTSEIRARRLISMVMAGKREAKAAEEKTKRHWFSRKPKEEKQGIRARIRDWNADIANLQLVMKLSMYYPNYLKEGDQNRLAETLFKIDRDINGEEKGLFSYWKHINVHVKMAEPVDVTAFIKSVPSEVQEDSDQLAAALGKEVESRVNAEISKMGQEAATRKLSGLRRGKN